LYRDCRRLGLLPATPISVGYLEGAEGATAALESRLPGLVARHVLASERPATDVLLLCGPTARSLTTEALERLLGEETSLCVVDVAGPPSVVRGLAGLSALAERRGFKMIDLRAVDRAVQGEPMQGQAYRATLCRTPTGDAREALIRQVLILDALGLPAAARTRYAAARHADTAARALLDGPYFRQGRIEGWGPLHAVHGSGPQRAHGTHRPGWRREEFPVLISIHIQSNKPENLVQFFDRIANSCDDPSRVEVIVKIDDDHVELNELLPREVARQPFRLKYISTPLVGGFFALWKSMNDMLAVTDPGAYFLLNLNDEMFFVDRGWDTRIARYVGLFPDHLYRLRTSVYRNRNYHDHWECGFAPETSAVTTKRWIETGGNWNPCLGPDTFQQCVAYYFNLINRHVERPRCREIPIDDIRFGGEGAYIGLTGAALRRRVRGATRAWFRLMSSEIQEEAARRAARLHATIAAHEVGIADPELLDDGGRRVIASRDSADGRTLAEYSYAVPRRWYRHLNAWRAMQFASFGGGGIAARRASLPALMSFLALRYDSAEKLRHWVFDDPEPYPVGSLPPSRLRRAAREMPYLLGRTVGRHIVHAPGYTRLYSTILWNRTRGYASLFWHRIVVRSFSIGAMVCRRVCNRVMGMARMISARASDRAVGASSLVWRRGPYWLKRGLWILTWPIHRPMRRWWRPDRTRKNDLD
jgi:hypothetical protein